MLLLLKNLLFTVVVPGSVAGYVPALILRGETPDQLAGGMPLWLLGAAIYAWTVWDFAVGGRGTPAPIDAPVRLVSRGLYRYVRNPMYVGVLAVILGWAVAYQSVSILVYSVVVWTCFHLFVLLYEEPHLRRIFGGEYEQYCDSAGRWLPRMRNRDDSKSR